MHFNMWRVDDDIVSMVVVIPNAKNNEDYEDGTCKGEGIVGFTLVIFEQFHFFLFQCEMHNGK